MIDIKNLSCAFNNKTILQNINLNIQSHLCILGANGSGKSTLAKAICGLIEQDGEVSINATDIKEFSLIQKAKLISYIPAKLEIYDSFISVEEFVLLGRFPYKRSFFEYSDKDKNIVQETLDFLKISPRYFAMTSPSGHSFQMRSVIQQSCVNCSAWSSSLLSSST